MTKDKMVLVLLMIIAVAAFAGGMHLLDRVEKEGLFQGQATWLYLNRRFRALLAEHESRKDQFSMEAQAVRARLLHNVGITCGYTEQWADALSILNQSADFNIKSKAVIASSVIQSIETLGKAYYVTGDYDSARTALDFAARDYMRENDGEENSAYARCLCFTGRVHLAMGDYKSADSCFEKAKQIFKKEEDRAATAKALLLLAESAVSRNDYKRAEEKINEAVPLFKVDLGDGYLTYFNDDVALLKCLKGQIQVNTAAANEQVEEGLRLVRDAVKQSALSYGEDDVYSQPYRLALAQAYLKKNDTASALSQVQKIESSFERIGLPKHPFLKRVYELHIKALGNTEQALKKELDSRMASVSYQSSKETLREADALGSRLNPSAKFLAGRSYTDPWILPLTLQIIAWAFSGMFAASFACAAKAARKDYGASVWFILGVFFSLIAYLIISALPTRNTLTKELGEDFSLIDDARTGVFLLSMCPLVTVLGASIFYYPAPLRDVFIAVFLAFCVCLVVYPPIWSFAIAKSKGRNPFVWFLIGLFTSIFGLCLLLLMKPGDNVEADEEETKNTQSETVMLAVLALHVALFLSVVANIYFSWMLHVEL